VLGVREISTAVTYIAEAGNILGEGKGTLVCFPLFRNIDTLDFRNTPLWGLLPSLKPSPRLMYRIALETSSVYGPYCTLVMTRHKSSI